MNTDNVAYALREVLRAAEEELNARERYVGYDWGYHGLKWTEQSRKANEAFQAALENAIDERVRAVLAKMELRPSSSSEESS